MKVFKKMFFVAAVAAVSMTFVSCDEDENAASAGKIEATVDTYGVTVTSVKAVVWNYDDDTSYEVARGAYKNGGFTIDLPATVPAEHLLSADDEDMPESVKISDANAKLLLFTEIEAYDGESYVGDFFYIGLVDANTVVVTAFAYADRDFTLVGSYTEEDEEDGTTETGTYNVSLKKGWNKMFVKQSETETTSTSEYTTTEPSGLIWAFIPNSFESSISTQTKAAKPAKEMKTTFSFFK